MHWKCSLLFVLLLGLNPATLGLVEAPPKCLVDLETPQAKYAHYMGHGTKVIIESSERLLHRITSEIFRIFSMEILGFAGVDINVVVDDFNLEKIVDRLSPAPLENVIFPMAMINLEVWVPSNYDLVYLEDTQLIKEYGYVAPPGRFGWFIPLDLGDPVKRFYEKNWSKDYQEVHWSFLRDRKVMAMFDIVDDALKIVKHNLLVNASKSQNITWCESKECNNGIYTPPQCHGVKCALLLTSSYNATKYVIDHVKQMNVFARVAFLDQNLEPTVKKLHELYRKNFRRDRSLLVMHYTPSALVLRSRDWISVAFQQCDMLNASYSIGCRYELNRLVKLSWSKVDSLGLQSAVRNFKFTTHDYEELITIYEEHGDTMNFRQLACEWMKSMSKTWKDWKTEHETNKIYIGGIFPLSGSGASGYNGPGIVRGALLATEAINSNDSILPNYKLNLIVSNGQCRPDKVMKSFIDYIVDGYYNNLIGVLGPACSDTVEPLAGVSKHYHIMVISYSAEGTSVSDREKYPYFFRTIGENNHYKHLYLALFKKMGWKRVAALTEDGQRYTEYISNMQAMMEENGINFISNTKFPRERTLQMTRYLEELKRKTARVIILDVFDEIARSVMCEAHHMKMTPKDGYVWFLPSWLNETWYNTDYFNTKRNETVNCTTAEMIDAVKGYFSMAHAYFAPDETVIMGNMTVAEWKVKFRNISHFKFDPGMSNYAGYAYDAIWTYALALDTLIKEDPEVVTELHSENTTNKLVQLIKDTDFYGVSGRIKFRGGPSRFSLINLMEFYDNQTHMVGVFYPNLTDDRPEILGGELQLNQSAIKWFTPNGHRPDDGAVPPTRCALESLSKFLNVTCEMAIVILNMIGAGILLVIVVTAVYMLKRRYDKKVKYTEEYMRHFGIDLQNPSAISDLDKWEIPRNSVVINRKLGEGAFGTVYGGEAEFPERGWVGVAVKTLKVGSSTEEKLDFLSEAEVMKRFDHKNIVKLLGVCTKEEPIYTIMEYMLYGDLKTYLLARRHLVNDKSIEESEEISSKKLTQMALDVARGLSYLAQLKYVHRDIASRNCLINSERVVKLGDFGMTRPMYENDYYRFTRKGMLPVRWMSPESLALGVFSPASDVWSYGILLYEIITFGSFPYQGMNNNQVLDYVKAGHTLTIPQGVKPQLKGLLKSCWNQDPKLRSRSSEIVEFLANNPRLIVPCLEVPLASVQMEDTNQLEITLPDQFRKCPSSNLMKTSPPPVANGIAHAHSLENLNQDNSIGMTTDCCPKEPLLGRSSSSIFNKFVTLHNNSDDRVTDHIDEEDYLRHNPSNNGYVITKV